MPEVAGGFSKQGFTGGGLQVVGRGERRLHGARKGTVLRERAPGPQGPDALSHLTDSTGRGRVASTLWIKT